MDHFPDDYFAARERFLRLAGERRAHIASRPIRARGPAGERLSIDTAYLGAAQPRRLLIIASGTHGVEGFAGSALQQQWLAQNDAAQLPPDGGCLLVHAVNPFGFAWLRRTNEHNVDLNRNALDAFPGPRNPAYRQLDGWLNPASAPQAIDFFLMHGVVLLLRRGFNALQQAIVGGQYEYPRSLFYGGDRREESIAHVEQIVTQAAFRSVEHVLVIDLHTGLGRFGGYKMMVDVAADSTAYRDFERWFGTDAVGSSRSAESAVYPVSGGLTEFIERRFGAERTRAGVLEFGTIPLPQLLAALRRENRAYHYAQTGDPALARAREKLRRAFCPDRISWRRRVLVSGARVIAQASDGLFGASRER